MVETTTKITAAEFLALPESSLPTELLDGKVVMTPAPSLSHQRLVGKLFNLVQQLGAEGATYFSPIDVYLDDASVVQPDVVWLAPGSRCAPVKDQYLRGAPDLVIEVLSPATARQDKSVKFRLYERHGVREYWMADPNAQYLEVWCLEGERFSLWGVFGPGETFTSTVLGGQAVDVKLLFTDSE